MKNKYNIYILLIIMTIVSVLAVGTYAALTWSSKENTELSFKIGNFAEVVFPPLEEDNDNSDGTTISGNNVTINEIGPVFDYTKDGEIIPFSVINLSPGNLAVDISFYVTTISDNLKNKDFKIAVQYSDTINGIYNTISVKDFASAVNSTSIILLSKQQITKNGYYKVIIYIDGNSSNNTILQNTNLNGYIKVDAVVA